MNTSSKAKPPLRVLLGIIFLISAMLILFLMMAYQIERSAFEEVQSEVGRIGKTVENRYEGVTQPSDGRGVGALTTLNDCWSNKCPFLARTWKLNLEKNSEVKVMKELMFDTGYTVTHEYPCSLSESTQCGVLAQNAKFHVDVNLTLHQASSSKDGAKMEADLRVLVTRR